MLSFAQRSCEGRHDGLDVDPPQIDALHPRLEAAGARQGARARRRRDHLRSRGRGGARGEGAGAGGSGRDAGRGRLRAADADRADQRAWTDWGPADAEAAASMDCDAVLVPKVDGPEDVAAVRAIVGEKPVWAMMETPRGCLNALAIAEAPGMAGLRHGDQRSGEGAGRAVPGGPAAADGGAGQTCLMAARAAGSPASTASTTPSRTRRDCGRNAQQGRDMGMDGKTLIHPAQIDVANAVFAPSEEEVALAERQIAAFDEALARRGRGSRWWTARSSRTCMSPRRAPRSRAPGRDLGAAAQGRAERLGRDDGLADPRGRPLVGGAFLQAACAGRRGRLGDGARAWWPSRSSCRGADGDRLSRPRFGPVWWGRSARSWSASTTC
jgi:hypothetical protein